MVHWGGGIEDLVIPVKAMGAYIQTVIPVDVFKKYKYVRAMTQAEMDTYLGLSSSVITINHTDFYIRKYNSSGTSTSLTTSSTTDIDISTLDLSNSVCIVFGIDGASNTNGAYCVYLHN